MRTRLSIRLQDDGTPIHVQMADRIREQIDSGQLAPGAAVEGENELMRRYGVPRSIARDALALLRSEGVIETVRDLGSFVRRFQPVTWYGSRRLRNEASTVDENGMTVDQNGQTVNADGATTGRQNESVLEIDGLRVGHAEAGEHIASLLKLKLGSAVVIRYRRYLRGGQPAQLATTYIPSEILTSASIAELEAEKDDAYAHLAELGYEPVRFYEELRARRATLEEGALLHLTAGAPVVVVNRVGTTDDDRTVIVDELIFNAAMYQFIYEVSA